MARKKLARFEDNAAMAHVLEPSRESLLQGWEQRGRWNDNTFGRQAPITLELGCGKGEYTIALARREPERHYVGVDLKGARIWYGANEARAEKMDNVAFLRTQIELIDRCFAPGEVAEIWITFPDPQIKHARAKHRLTNPDFLEKYRRILKPGGRVHLKTDSAFMHGYTVGVLQGLGLPIYMAYYDIDKQLGFDKDHPLHQVRTYYEELFRAKGHTVTYIQFGLEK